MSVKGYVDRLEEVPLGTEGIFTLLVIRVRERDTGREGWMFSVRYGPESIPARNSEVYDLSERDRAVADGRAALLAHARDIDALARESASSHWPGGPFAGPPPAGGK